MAQIFISHVSKDKERIRPHLEALIQSGRSLFIDRPDELGFDVIGRAEGIGPMSTWSPTILAALVNADFVFIFWSEAAV